MESPERIQRAARLENVGRTLVVRPDSAAAPLLPRRSDLARLGLLLADGQTCPVLVGESGAGKSALFAMLGHSIALVREAGEVSFQQDGGYQSWLVGRNGRRLRRRPSWLDKLVAREFIEVTAISIASDCFYTFNLENKLELIVAQCRETGACLVLEDVHLLATAGASGADPASTVANLLVSQLGRGGFQVTGATTPAGWAHLQRFAPDFVRRLHPVAVAEATRIETVSILQRLMRWYEEQQNRVVEPGLEEEICDAADRFCSTRALPGRAVDLLKHTVGVQTDARAATSDAAPSADVVTGENLVSALKARLGLRRAFVDTRRPLSRDKLRTHMRRRIVGQTEAVEAVIDRVLAFRAGLTDSRRPPAVLLFAGPSGVGKTELTLALAELMFGSDAAVARYDMSEFRSSENVERFIGTAQGRELKTPSLVERLRANPTAVILLDEIEKAHPAVWTLFLQAFSDGAQLTGADGQVASLRNAFVVMTTNIGSDLFRNSGPLGFAPSSDVADNSIECQLTKRLRQAFSPEFLNRISRTVMFHPLTREEARAVTELEINKATTRASRGGIADVSIAADVFERVLQQGYSLEFGARPLQRAVEDAVLTPLAELLCESPASADCPILVHLHEGKPTATVGGRD